MKKRGGFYMVQTVKRWILLLVGLSIMAFGVGFSIQGNLGTSPISSLPYVTGQISGLTVGNTTIILHCILILGQFLLLRRNFKIISLLQLPIAIFFGYMCDFALWVEQGVTAGNYLMRWVLCAIGIVLVAIGVSCEVVAGVMQLAGEAFVLTICQVFHTPFGRTKVGFDVSLVVIASILSFVFLHGLYGVREGTVAAALLVGTISKQINPHLKKAVEKIGIADPA